MFKYAVVIFAIVACAAAKPGLLGALLAYTAPAAAVLAAPAPVVTATSSQFVARNHNGIASAPVVAPVGAAYNAPLVAEYAAAGPLAYPAPVIAKYATAYSHPLAYSAPLTYAAAPASVLL